VEIPLEALRFSVVETPYSILIKISSKKWEIVGFGTGEHFAESADDLGEIRIDSIAGYRSAHGSSKRYLVKRNPGQRFRIIAVNSKDGQRTVK
jgi:hypothetical protein